MQRKATAKGLLNFLNMAMDDYNIRSGFEKSLGKLPERNNGKEESVIEFIKTDEQRQEVQGKAFALMCEIPFDPDNADAMVDEIMNNLHLTDIPIDRFTSESTQAAAASVQNRHAAFFRELPVGAVQKSKKVEIEVTDDMTVGDLYTQLTGRKPGQ